MTSFAATAWLGRTLSPYGEIAELPTDHEAWSQLFEIADRSLVLPRLAARLAALDDRLPPAVIEYLSSALELNHLRNLELRSQLLTLLETLNCAGVTPGVMKGATSLLGPVDELGLRVMLDIDIWISDPGQQQVAMGCLTGLGYRMKGTLEEFTGTQHFPPFFLEGALSRIELHHQMLHPIYAGLIDEARAAQRLQSKDCEGRHYLCLDEADALGLSYIQCREYAPSEVPLMKWFDLLDRFKASGRTAVDGPAGFGLAMPCYRKDARLLTALSLLCGLPYEGTVDTGMMDALEHPDSTLAGRFLLNVAGNALDGQRWRNRTAADYWKAVARRIRDLPGSLRRARDGSPR